MKFQERELWGNIKSGDFYPVYLVQGTEAYLKQNYVKLLSDSAIPAGLEGFNLHRLNGETCTLEDLFTAVESLPAMSPRTCVVVHDLDFASLNDSDSDAMADLLSDLPDTCVLIFWQDTKAFPKKTKKQKELLKLIDKAGVVATLDGRSRGALVKFVVHECEKRGTEISANTAVYILDNVGQEMENLLSEIDKLCSYAGGTATEADVDAVCSKTLESTSFKMVDALAADDFDGAFRSLAILLEQKTEPAMILGAVTSTYVDMYRAGVVKAAGQKPALLKTIYPGTYKSDYRVTNAFRRIRKYSPEALRRSLEVLSEADTKLKSTMEDSRTVLETLLVELSEVRHTC